MIETLISKLKKAETGQSIIILAFAFIVLLGFVGLTTDVSLMFVRYATIRRAVDSASIAAATQMRQGVEESAVQIAARQFIEFHGLDAVQVVVNTCQTLNKEDSEVMDLPEQIVLREELCTEDQRKLVKVTVQAQSPTVFLRLLGWNNFTLQASALSETAALDVVLIMDVAESMASQTSYDDWANIGMGFVYVPPKINEIVPKKVTNGTFVNSTSYGDVDAYWRTVLLASSQKQNTDRLDYGNGDTGDDPDYLVKEFILETDAKVGAKYTEDYGFPADVSQFEPREDCRLRFWPFSTSKGVLDWVGRNERTEPPQQDFQFKEQLTVYYTPGGVGDIGFYKELGVPWGGDKWDGFVPTYNFYGCCNDPGSSVTDPDTGVTTITGSSSDGSFEDLICQPFRGARDAVELFLDSIDFVRGDRVAYVTFDRSAYLVNPYNEVSKDQGRSHMIDNYSDAKSTLRRVIGVRAEPNFYIWDDAGSGPGYGGWKATGSPFSAGVEINPVTGLAQSSPVDYNVTPDDGTPADYNYPVYANCPFQNATLDPGKSLYNGSLARIAHPYPQLATDWGTYKPLSGVGVNDTMAQMPENAGLWSYELWASCRGGNVGAALREANNALLDPSTSRRFGAVWVMILLSDGAVGASDPVRRDGEKLDVALPYADTGNTDANGIVYGQAGEYGAFGVCPYGTPTEPGEIVLVADDLARYNLLKYPFCSDESPMSRHDCDFRPPEGIAGMQDNDYVTYEEWVANGGEGPTSSQEEVEWNSSHGNLYDVDIAPENCHPLYDVDDYAHDWAEFIGLQESDGNELLPTIFTIGFGITFGDEPAPDLTYYVKDYLGEQLLRHIADVGDNNLLDNDYYQDILDINGETGTTDDPRGFGARDACQDQTFSADPNFGYDYNNNGFLEGDERDSLYEPLPPRVSCGNYFNAPNADELQLVFDAIASRMFTRIAG